MKITENQYAELLLEISQDKSADYQSKLSNFIKLIRRNRKLSSWRKIAAIFTSLYNQKNDILPLKIITAEDLTATQKQSLVKTLTTKLSKTIEPVFKTDPTIIGGLKIIGPDFLIENSISNHLNKLKTNS